MLANRTLQAASGVATGYHIPRSLRFRAAATAFLNRTPPSSTVAGRQKWTWSGWVKRGQISLANSQYLMSADISSILMDAFYFHPTDALMMYFEGSGYKTGWVTNAVFRDTSAWYHIVVVRDTTQAAVIDMCKFYVNGVQQTVTINNYGSTYVPQNFAGWLNDASSQRLGMSPYFGAYLDGYMSEVNFIDGQALTPSSFGQTDITTGSWVAKRYTGTYGTNGFYLPFSDTTGINTALTATASAPNGGNAATLQVIDGIYLTTNTSTGAAFDVFIYDFGVSKQMVRYALNAFYFTGGASTFELQTSNDGVNYTTAVTLSVTGTGTNYSGNIYKYARYIKLRATAFGTNGTANIESAFFYYDSPGLDSSGLGNAWQTNNISLTAGSNYDSMLDVPAGNAWADGGNGRGNYCTLNPLVPASWNPGTYSEGNLKITSPTSSVGYGYFTQYIDGKIYAEFAPSNIFNDTSNYVGVQGGYTRFYASSGQIWNGSAWNAYGTAYAAPNVIGMAVDTVLGTIEFFANGVSQGKITGLTTGPVSILTSSYILNGNAYWYYNFGQRPFTYTPPTGFKALHTGNLTAPTIKKSNLHFDTTIYTGTGAIQSIVNSGTMQPDLVWAKARNNAWNHGLQDSVRGVTNLLSSNITNGDQVKTDELTSFNSNGFSLGASAAGYTNLSGTTYVAWQWKAGGTAVTNTAGSITSQVSANPTAGFSIVTYTGTGANATVGHGLDVAPKMVIVKNRDTAANDWMVLHTSLASPGYYLFLNLIDPTGTSGTVFNFTNPTSTVFSVGTHARTNEATKKIVAYCFAEISGFSKFGSYTGNGSTDGPFVYCGFRPRYLMTKRTDSTGGGWRIWDAVRMTSNVIWNTLDAELNSAEVSAQDLNLGVDFVSNGFKVRTLSSFPDTNASGGTYIFMAFAESPFKYANAR